MCGRAGQEEHCTHVAMGHNLWLHFGVDEHPFAAYFDVHQGYRVLTPKPTKFLRLLNCAWRPSGAAEGAAGQGDAAPAKGAAAATFAGEGAAKAPPGCSTARRAFI